jgi:AAA15 family ATPase/GTPase
MIKTLSISNFKGIKKLTLNLKKINIFVGRNNTGKSTILDSILTLFYPYTNNLISKISYPLPYNLYQGTTEATIQAIFHPRQSKLTDFAHMTSGKPNIY